MNTKPLAGPPVPTGYKMLRMKCRGGEIIFCLLLRAIDIGPPAILQVTEPQDF